MKTCRFKGTFHVPNTKIFHPLTSLTQSSNCWTYIVSVKFGEAPIYCYHTWDRALSNIATAEFKKLGSTTQCTGTLPSLASFIASALQAFPNVLTFYTHNHGREFREAPIFLATFFPSILCSEYCAQDRLFQLQFKGNCSFNVINFSKLAERTTKIDTRPKPLDTEHSGPNVSELLRDRWEHRKAKRRVGGTSKGIVHAKVREVEVLLDSHRPRFNDEAMWMKTRNHSERKKCRDRVSEEDQSRMAQSIFSLASRFQATRV